MTDALKNWRRDIKNVQYDEIETQIRDATCNSPDQPSSDLIARIGTGMCDRNKYRLAWFMLWKRATDEKVPKHVSKALVLIDLLLRVNPPSPQVQSWLAQNLKEFESAQYLSKLRQGEGAGALTVICELAKTLGKFIAEYKEPDPTSFADAHASDGSRNSTQSLVSPSSPTASFNTPATASPPITSSHGVPQSPPSRPVPTPVGPRLWVCKMCTFENQPNSSTCEVCACVKPAGVTPSISNLPSSASSMKLPISNANLSSSSSSSSQTHASSSSSNSMRHATSSLNLAPSPSSQSLGRSSSSANFGPGLAHSSSSANMGQSSASHRQAAAPPGFSSPNQPFPDQPQQQSRWECPRCKFSNPGPDIVCGICFGARPSIQPTPAPTTGRTWLCSMCRHGNKETAAACAACWCSRPIDVVFTTPGVPATVAAASASALARQTLGALPAGWEERIDPRINRSYFMNHAKGITTWDDPRVSKAPPVEAGPPAYDEPAPATPISRGSVITPTAKKAWVCSLCTAHNTAESAKCLVCEAPRVGNEPAPPEEKPKPTPPLASTPTPTKPATTLSSPAAVVADNWACGICSYLNTLPKYQLKCEICDGPRPILPATPKEEGKLKVDGWECDWCYTANDTHLSHCQLCFSPKPNSKLAGEAKPKSTSNTLQRSAAVWQCSRCCHASKYVVCQICGQAEPEKHVESTTAPPKPVATLSTAVFSGGSWQCSFCDVINNAKKEECRICSRSRAVAAVADKPPTTPVAPATVSDPFASLDAFSNSPPQFDLSDDSSSHKGISTPSTSTLPPKYSEPPSPSFSSAVSANEYSSSSAIFEAPPPPFPTTPSSSSSTTTITSSSPFSFIGPPSVPPPAHLLAKVLAESKLSSETKLAFASPTTTTQTTSSTPAPLPEAKTPSHLPRRSSEAKQPPPSPSTAQPATPSLASSILEKTPFHLPRRSSGVKGHISSPSISEAPPRKYSGIASPTPSVPVEKGVEDLDQAAKIRAEIFATEQTYVFNLTRLLTVFIRPINQKSKSFGLSQAQTVDLCGNIFVIARLHTLLVQDMQKEDLVEVLLKNADFLKIYTNYVNNYEKMISTITVLSKNKNFEKFLAETESEHMSLPSFLIMPIQRIPRYCLLLRELQKNTADDAPNYPRLCLALEKLKAIAACINEQKRKFENTSQLLDIQTRIRSPAQYLILKPNRWFVRQGKLKRMDDDTYYYFFLFNDALLQTTDRYKVVQEMSITTLTVQARSVDTVLFTILQKQHRGKMAEFNLLTEVAAERDAWVSDLQTAIGSNPALNMGVSMANLVKPDESYDIIIEGSLQKRSPKNNRYQERYFELLPSVLIYRKRKGAPERAGEIRLREVTATRAIERPDKKGGEFEIDVKSVGDLETRKYGAWRTFTLLANTGAEASKWLKFIQKQREANVPAAAEPEEAPPMLQSSGATVAQLRSQADVIRTGWVMVKGTTPLPKKGTPLFVKRFVVLTPGKCTFFVTLDDMHQEKAEMVVSLSSKPLLACIPKGSVAKEEASWGLECTDQKFEFELCTDERDELPNLTPLFHFIPEPDLGRRKEMWLYDFRIAIPTTLFGVSIELAAKRSDPLAKVPAPIATAIKWLDERGLEEQGLYRIPGSKTEVENLIVQFDRGETVRIPDQYSGSNLASLIVQYLRRLPENLFTNQLAPIFQRAMGSEQQLSMLKLLLGKLPLAHFCTIRALIRHLVKVSQHSEVNEMTAQNLSICVYTSMAQVMNALIVNCDYVFDQPEPGEVVAVEADDAPAFGLS